VKCPVTSAIAPSAARRAPAVIAVLRREVESGCRLIGRGCAGAARSAVARARHAGLREERTLALLLHEALVLLLQLAHLLGVHLLELIELPL